MTPPPPPALSCENVGVTFDGLTPVANASLYVADGEFVCVVGPTGCGKSTLLNLCAGLTFPDSGRIDVLGQALEGLNAHAGYLFQVDALLPWYSALDNIALAPRLAGIATHHAHAQAHDWLARVGLCGFASHFPHQLSGGMRKRVALAQVLIRNPRLLLMDEPFSALDLQTRQLMQNLLLSLWERERKAVLFVTHDLDEAIALADRVIVLSAGPAAHPIGSIPITLPRPRDVMEIRTHPAFITLHQKIWQLLRGEVLKNHTQAHAEPRP
ncbi:Taurine import ATP-binding protein TauB [compost metagenome]